MGNNIIKLVAGTILGLMWITLLIIKHKYPDIDTSGVIVAINSALVGLGILHVKGSADSKTGPTNADNP
jgi:hypothetical protein